VRAPKFNIAAGTSVAVCEVFGDPKRQPEPEELRIAFPGGELSLIRTDDGSYWVHVLKHEDQDGVSGRADGEFRDARIDVRSKHASDTDAGDFAHPETYHVAVRVGVKNRQPMDSRVSAGD